MSNYNEEELLNFLMTSEFNEGFTPEQYKFFLIKFRNFYRIVSCSVEYSRERMSHAIQEKEQIEQILIKNSEEFNIEKSNLINKLYNIKTKKLTL